MKIEQITEGMSGAQAAAVIQNNSIAGTNPPWSAQEYVGGFTVSHKNTLFRLPEGVTAAANETPENSLWSESNPTGKWVAIGGSGNDERLDEILTYYMTPQQDSAVLEQTILAATTASIRGVEPAQGLLTGTNVVAQVGGTDIERAWRNIPVRHEGSLLMRVEYSGYQLGGQAGAHSVLLGVKDGVVTNIIPSINGATPSEPIQVTAEVANYDFVSIAFFTVNSGQRPNIDIKLFSAPDEPQKDGVRKDIERVEVIAQSKAPRATSIPLQNGTADLTLSNNFHGRGNSITLTNARETDFASIFLMPSSGALTVSPTVIWQNDTIDPLVEGRGYFIVLNTFNGGTSWVGSVVGSWDAAQILPRGGDDFDRANVSPLLSDNFGNPYVVSTGASFAIENRELIKLSNASSGNYTFIGISGDEENAIVEVESLNADFGKVGVFSAGSLNLQTFAYVFPVGGSQLWKGFSHNGTEYSSSSPIPPRRAVNKFKIEKAAGTFKFYMNETLLLEQKPTVVPTNGTVAGLMVANSATGKIAEGFKVF